MGYRQDVRWAQLTGRLAREAERAERERAAARGGVKLPEPGTRVRLVSTSDSHTRLQPGDEGTVSLIDAVGTLFVNWDSGSSLGLIFGEDEWEVIP